MIFNTLNSKTSLIIFFSILFSCISCQKDSIKIDQNKNYRIKFVGNYLSTGTTHDWNEATGLDDYNSDTIILVVAIDSFSGNKIYVNDDLIPIDSSGFFSEFYFENYHDYRISFFAEDSVRYFIATGGLGGGHWGDYLGKKH